MHLRSVALPILLFLFCLAFLAPLYADERSARTDIDTGRALFALARYPEAQELFERAVASLSGGRSSAGDEAAYWLILARVARGEKESVLPAIEEFRTARRDSALLPDLLYQRGRIQFALGDYPAAQATFIWFIEERLLNHPLRASAFFWLGECQYALDKLEQSRDTLSGLLRDYPDSVKREPARTRLKDIEARFAASKTMVPSATDGVLPISPLSEADRMNLVALRDETIRLLDAYLQRLRNEVPR